MEETLMSIREHLKIIVTGYLEEIDFYYYTVLKANNHDIFGCIKQISDETLIIEAEGTKYNLEKFIELFNKGTLHSYVKHLTIEVGLLTDHNKFRVLKNEQSKPRFRLPDPLPLLGKHSFSFRNFLH